MTTVSVVLPTYNRAPTISRAVDSVIAQTYTDLELVIVDDSSTDNTREVVDQYEENIQYIRHETNRGAPVARNTGIENSSGDYIAFIDSDDEWHREKIEKQVRKFSESSPDVGVVYTGYNKSFRNKYELGHVPSKRGDIFEDQLMTDWVNPTSTVMVRSECFEKVGGFNTSLAARQDYELWTRIARHYHFEYIQEPLVTMHVTGEDRITENVEARMEAHQKVLELIHADIRSLPWHKRRQALGIQYFTMGRYLQKNRAFHRALSHFFKSIRFYPLNWKAYTALILVLLHFDTQEDAFITLKNVLRDAWKR